MFATAQKSASRSNEGAHVRSHRGRAARTCLTVVSADANVWLFSATTLHFRQYCAHAIDETGETHAATLGRHAC